MRDTRRVASGAVLALCLVTPLEAQVVRGALVEAMSGRGVSGAFVSLLDEAGVEHQRVMTDALGRWTLEPTSAGRFLVRAVAVGRQSWTSNPFAIDRGDTLQFPIEMPLLPVALPAMVVEADRDCRVRPEAGLAAAQLWDEAKKALEAVVWTERQGMLQHRIARYDRTLHPRTLTVEEERRTHREGLYRGSPFVTQSPKLLDDVGYVRRVPTGEWEYNAPDATVLLSDAFADWHCFGVAASEQDQPELVGLQFEPVRRRDVTDIQGVLWLDGASAELRYLEYWYRRLPAELHAVESRRIGGRVEFVRLPEGPWIVSRWWIRMPEVGLRPPPAGRLGHETVLLALREQGGVVEEVRTLKGDVVWRGDTLAVAPERR